MRTLRRLDRGRNHGQIFPPLGRACFAQDHLTFDAAGWCIEDGPPPTPEELKQITGETKGPPKGASSVSKPKEDPPPPGETVELIARTSMEWKTKFKFPDLRKALMAQKNFNAPNQVAALRYLDSQGLVVKDGE